MANGTERKMTSYYVSSKSEFPTGPHWAILHFSSVHVPGDERSRTNPGHGYPAHDVQTTTYQAFEIEVEWLAEIKKLVERDYGRERFVAFKASGPASFSVSVNVNVDLP